MNDCLPPSPLLRCCCCFLIAGRLRRSQVQYLSSKYPYANKVFLPSLSSSPRVRSTNPAFKMVRSTSFLHPPCRHHLILSQRSLSFTYRRKCVDRHSSNAITQTQNLFMRTLPPSSVAVDLPLQGPEGSIQVSPPKTKS